VKEMLRATIVVQFEVEWGEILPNANTRRSEKFGQTLQPR
jgi:hypothetical protein